MAEIVLGIGTSHSPQVSTTWEQWPNMRRTEERSPAIPPDLAAQLEPGVLRIAFRLRAERRANAVPECLRSTAALDAIVIFGDDQYEQFDDTNMPAIAIYHGERVPVTPPNRGAHDSVDRPRRAAAPHLRAGRCRRSKPIPTRPSLAGHIVPSLTEQEFDLARCDKLRTERDRPRLRVPLPAAVAGMQRADRPDHAQHLLSAESADAAARLRARRGRAPRARELAGRQPRGGDRIRRSQPHRGRRTARPRGPRRVCATASPSSSARSRARNCAAERRRS